MSESPGSPGRRLWLRGAAAFGSWVAGGAALVAAAQPSSTPADRRHGPARAPRLAVVLGAGSAHGFAHIGVIKALDAAGIRPDLIVGCSAGALVGAFWAAGFSGSKMETLADRVRDQDIVDAVAGGASRPGMVLGQALQNFVNDGTDNRPINGLATPFLCVATRYPTGELQVFDRGDIGFAVRASCSIPGVFMPPSRQGQTYLDAGLVSPLPVQTARAAGAGLVVAVDVGASNTDAADPAAGMYGLLMRSFEIMGDSLRRNEAALADIVIRPEVSRIASTDFSARHALVEAGFMAGARLAPVIQEKLRLRR
ncbi:MAG: patatin-like phospholipase family protein [Burkholderiales bacterium]|nr:patatin-like phospholipase family protein [Burkholderiales bacterium]